MHLSCWCLVLSIPSSLNGSFWHWFAFLALSIKQHEMSTDGRACAVYRGAYFLFVCIESIYSGRVGQRQGMRYEVLFVVGPSMTLGIRLVIAYLELGFISFFPMRNGWTEGCPTLGRCHPYNCAFCTQYGTAMERRSLGSSTGQDIFNRPMPEITGSPAVLTHQAFLIAVP